MQYLCNIVKFVQGKSYPLTILHGSILGGSSETTRQEIHPNRSVSPKRVSTAPDHLYVEHALIYQISACSSNLDTFYYR
jgi:hypothetical protein